MTERRHRLAGQARGAFALALLGLLLLASPRAWALNCAVGVTDVNFGLVSPTNGSVRDTQGTVNYACSTGFLESFVPVTVAVCVGIGDGNGGSYNANPGGFRKMRSGNNVIPFDLYQDAARSAVWGWGYSNSIPAFPPTILVTIPGSLFGATSSGSRPLYARAFGSSGLANGTYANQFPTSEVRVEYAVSSDSNYCSRRFNGGGATNASFTAQAQVLTQCVINATDMEFGTATTLNTARQATSTITVNCLSGAPYQVGLSAGSGAGASINSRRMTRVGGTEQATYQLYRNAARTLVWGTTLNTDTVTGVGNGSNQSLPVYGLVPVQTTPAPGNYLDTVVATITF